MHLAERSPYGTLFFQSLNIWLRFKGVDSKAATNTVEDFRLNGTTVCHLLRLVLVCAPLAITVNLLVIGGVLASVTYLPIMLFGPKAYIVTCINLAMLGGSIGGFFFVGAWARDEIKMYRRLVREGLPSVPISRVGKLATRVLGGFDKAIAMSRRACSMIHFKCTSFLG